MIIKHANVYTPEHVFAVGDITIRDGRIVFGAEPLPDEEIKAEAPKAAEPAVGAAIEAATKH